MSQSVLHEIVKKVGERMMLRRSVIPFLALEERAQDARYPHSLVNALKKAGIHAISEVKFRSPALGVLEKGNKDLAVQIASGYFESGATAISVLTEEDYFHGNPTYLTAIRNALPEAILLMKDFVIDEYQILEGLLLGADVILLIVAVLGKDRTEQLMNFAHAHKLSTLVEVHDDEELNDALAIGAPVIGINNRNLKTLAVDLQTSFDLIKKVPSDSKNKVVFVSESGIRNGQEIKSLHAAGFTGFLVGSTFMTSGNPGAALAALLKEASS